MAPAIDVIFNIAILIFSVVVHEVSHGLAAHALGDQTAKYAGRLTLNPIKHLDPIGSLLVPFLSYSFGGIIIGWAKPVPYNPNNLNIRNQEIGSAIVGLAGPVSNVIVALVFGLILRFFAGVLVQIDPALIQITATIAIINLILAVFNLVPIPPLDGSKVLFSVFPREWAPLRNMLERFGFILLVLFIISFSGIILPIVAFLFRSIAGIQIPL